MIDIYSTLWRRGFTNSHVEKTHHIQRTEFGHQLSGQGNGFWTYNRCWVNVEVNWSHWRTGEVTCCRRSAGRRIRLVCSGSPESTYPTYLLFFTYRWFQHSFYTMKTFTVEGRYLQNTFEMWVVRVQSLRCLENFRTGGPFFWTMRRWTGSV